MLQSKACLSFKLLLLLLLLLMLLLKVDRLIFESDRET